jgi:hypothetical protein
VLQQSENADRYVNEGVAVARARLDNADVDRRILTQAIGQNAAGGPRANNDIVELIIGRASIIAGHSILPDSTTLQADCPVKDKRLACGIAMTDTFLFDWMCERPNRSELYGNVRPKARGTVPPAAGGSCPRLTA